MKKILTFIILLLFAINNWGQTKISKLHSKQNLDCSVCHECETPTKTNPCLAKCPRENVNVMTFKVNDAPEFFYINNVRGEKDLYAPVKFSHKIHAEMSEIEKGCVTCHHYNPPGKIVKCNYCHEAKRERDDKSKPDLKAAYHRQCMNCHASWEKGNRCESCHKLNDEYKPKESSNVNVVKVHKPVVRPQSLVYETKFEKGKVVTFHHDEHIKLFEFECRDCHQNEECKSCHNQKPNFKKTINTENHNRCKSCHNTESKNNCTKCHKKSETKPFNHFVNTGFNLNKFHSRVACNSCHKSKGKYSGLKSECSNCHDWNENNFNHSITGLQLSEDHLDLECGDCHENNNYSKPTCTSCHEEEEGFVVPQKLPGKRIK